MNITAFEEIKYELNQHKARLVAVSKTQSIEKIAALYHAGQRIFGENKVQEMCDKQSVLPNNIEWHLIGHLQRNKVKYIAPFVSMIHSVDSMKLLQEINKQALNSNRIIACLLQFHIAQEETKFGLNEAEASQLLQSPTFLEMKNIAICGVMGMATNTNNKALIKQEFMQLQSIFDSLKIQHFKNDSRFKEISMGMSSDYKIALQCGSTLVRIGSKLFGERNYE